MVGQKECGALRALVLFYPTIQQSNDSTRLRVAGGSPGWQVAGHNFRSRVSGIGYLVQVFGFWCRCGLIDFLTANR